MSNPIDPVEIALWAIRDMERATEHLRRGRINQAMQALVVGVETARRDLSTQPIVEGYARAS